MVDKLEILKKKLLYRASYRGTKEMDILLSSFVKYYVSKLNIDELKELEIFLNFEDEIILDYYNNDISRNNINKNGVSKYFKKFKI